MASRDGRVDILMVEDNPNDEELTLHERRKYHLANTIQVVRDGQEALEYIFCTGRYADRDVNEHPNVILLDIKLPFIDGLEVLRRVKQDPRTRTIPVVMLTSSREERDLIASYRLGVNSYIVKPVDVDQAKEAARARAMSWLPYNPPVRPPPIAAAVLRKAMPSNMPKAVQTANSSQSAPKPLSRTVAEGQLLEVPSMVMSR